MIGSATTPAHSETVQHQDLPYLHPNFPFSSLQGAHTPWASGYIRDTKRTTPMIPDVGWRGSALCEASGVQASANEVRVSLLVVVPTVLRDCPSDSNSGLPGVCHTLALIRPVLPASNQGCWVPPGVRHWLAVVQPVLQPEGFKPGVPMKEGSVLTANCHGVLPRTPIYNATTRVCPQFGDARIMSKAQITHRCTDFATTKGKAKAPSSLKMPPPAVACA